MKTTILNIVFYLAFISVILGLFTLVYGIFVASYAFTFAGFFGFSVCSGVMIWSDINQTIN